MTRMRVRQLTSCRDHRRAIIVLEDGGTVFVHVAAGEIGVPCYAPDPIEA